MESTDLLEFTKLLWISLIEKNIDPRSIKTEVVNDIEHGIEWLRVSYKTYVIDFRMENYELDAIVKNTVFAIEGIVFPKRYEWFVELLEKFK